MTDKPTNVDWMSGGFHPPQPLLKTRETIATLLDGATKINPMEVFASSVM